LIALINPEQPTALKVNYCGADSQIQLSQFQIFNFSFRHNKVDQVKKFNYFFYGKGKKRRKPA
jgi:hypothetical protein